MAEFFIMGGHGVYIWLAYGIAAISLGALALQSVKAGRDARRQVESLRPRRRKEA